MKKSLLPLALFVATLAAQTLAQNEKPFHWINPLTPAELKAAPGLSHHTIRSAIVDEEVGYCVFTPPGYDAPANRDRRYPVIYMLHGGRPGDESKFASRIPFILEAINAGRLVPTLVVLNNGGPTSHYNVPGQVKDRGKDLFVEELMPLIDRTYRTIATREGRALQGYSQGGRATARIGFGHPELFSQLVIGSAGAAPEKRIRDSGGAEREDLVFAPGDDMWTYTKRYAKEYKQRYPMEIFVHVGDALDYNHEGNLEYDAYLTQLGLDHAFQIVPNQKHGAQAYERMHDTLIAFQNRAFQRSLSLAAAPRPLMVVPGECILSWDFNAPTKIDRSQMTFRKETAHVIEDGSLRATPPMFAKNATDKKTKWGDSNFARAGLVGLPQEYVCHARWKYIMPSDPKTLADGLLYIDLGHRMIRSTLSREGTMLLLENHLTKVSSGGEDKKISIPLQSALGLTLAPDQWYDIVAEVKGDEVVIQINNHVLYGKHDLIAAERYDTFNLDSIGDGFLIDQLDVWKAGDYQPDWTSKRDKFAKQ